MRGSVPELALEQSESIADHVGIWGAMVCQERLGRQRAAQRSEHAAADGTGQPPEQQLGRDAAGGGTDAEQQQQVIGR